MKEEPKQEQETYTIECTKEQAQVMETALEVYSRIGTGQLDKAVSIVPFPKRRGKEVAAFVYSSLINALRDLAPCMTGLPHGASCGILQPDVHISCRAAYDMYKTLLHARSWHEHPEGGMLHPFDDPNMLKAADWPLIRVKIEGR